MTTGAVDSISEEQATAYQKSSLLHLVATKKSIVIVSLIALAIISLVLFGFNKHVHGQGNTTADAQAAANQEPKPDTTPVPQPGSDAATDPTTGDNGTPPASVSVQYNSSNTTSSDPANNSSTSSLTVNGQQVPTSGKNVHEHYTSSDGSTSVDISSSNHSSSGGGME